MSEEERPNYSRRRHQAILKRRQRRRQSRMRRLRAIKTLLGIRFWLRTFVLLLIGLCIAFWAKFALVYDIPPDLDISSVSALSAYVTLKPWWFGPPAFDLENYAMTQDAPYLSTAEAVIQGLGRYGDVVNKPVYVWLMKR